MSDEPNKDIAQKLLNTFNQKKYKSLSNSISDLQNEYPYSIFLLNLLGATQLQLNNYDYAIECYNKIIDLNKNFADAYYNLAIIYKEQNNTKESIKNYNKCIKLIQKNSRHIIIWVISIKIIMKLKKQLIICNHLK